MFCSYQLLSYGLFYPPVVIGDCCCSFHLLHVRDECVTFWPHFFGCLCRRRLSEGQKETNSRFSIWMICRLDLVLVTCVCVCVCVCVGIISVRLASGTDRCVQGAASQPHGTLEHVGQIYGLMLPLTTRHRPAVTGDISEASRCN